MTTTQLCACVYARGRKLYEKFHENLGQIPPDFDSITDAERDAWTRTVAGKGNFIEVEERPKRRIRAPKQKDEAPTREPQPTDYVAPDWKAKEKEQKREIAKVKAEAKRESKKALNTPLI